MVIPFVLLAAGLLVQKNIGGVGLLPFVLASVTAVRNSRTPEAQRSVFLEELELPKGSEATLTQAKGQAQRPEPWVEEPELVEFLMATDGQSRRIFISAPPFRGLYLPSQITQEGLLFCLKTDGGLIELRPEDVQGRSN